MEILLVVLVYWGYGMFDWVFVRGYVLDDCLFYDLELGDSFWCNLWAMLSCYFSIIIFDIKVDIQFNGQSYQVWIDEWGQFELLVEGLYKFLEGWYLVVFRVYNLFDEGLFFFEYQEEVYISYGIYEFGVIFDVDDMILVFYVMEIFWKLRLIFIKNVVIWLFFLGVFVFYQFFCVGKEGDCNNLIFFISSSEWNLYDFLVDFCQARNIFKGIFLLQAFKLGLKDFFRIGGGMYLYKLDKVWYFMEVFLDLKFILIGDSGQYDV